MTWQDKMDYCEEIGLGAKTISLFLFLSVVCVIILTHLFLMRSSTNKTSQTKTKASMTSLKETEKQLLKDLCSQSAMCSEPMENAISTSSLPEPTPAQPIPSTLDDLTPYSPQVANPQPIQDTNPTESSVGIIQIRDEPLTTNIRSLCFNSWWEKRPGWQKEKQVILLRLKYHEGWVIVPYDDMIPRQEMMTFYTNDDGHMMTFYDPEGYPPFGSYSGIVLPSKYVTNVTTFPVPDWDVYLKTVSSIYQQ